MKSKTLTDTPQLMKYNTQKQQRLVRELYLFCLAINTVGCSDELDKGKGRDEMMKWKRK